MPPKIVDPGDFITDGLFREDQFLKSVANHDWQQYAGHNILVRGCSTTIPPWAYMYLTAKIMPLARSIRYGNEHDNIVVFRLKKDS